MSLEFTVEQRALQEVAKRLRDEADGTRLVRDMSRQLRVTVNPAKERAASRLKSIGHRSRRPTKGKSLREAVEDKLKTKVRTTGRSTGITVWVSTTGMPRDFQFAGRYLNRRKGWRHPVFGRRRNWVTQRANPAEWFDRPMQDARDDVVKAAKEVLDDVAKRIVR